jgi:hypothetical protein
MILKEMVTPALDPATAKKMAKVVKAFTAEVKKYSRGANAKISMTVTGEFSAKVHADMNLWMRPESMESVWEDTLYAIEKADDAGHIKSITEDGSGPEYSEAILSGLRPGMKLTAEAFFPVIGYEIEWKKIISKK